MLLSIRKYSHHKFVLQSYFHSVHLFSQCALFSKCASYFIHSVHPPPNPCLSARRRGGWGRLSLLPNFQKGELGRTSIFRVVDLKGELPKNGVWTVWSLKIQARREGGYHSHNTGYSKINLLQLSESHIESLEISTWKQHDQNNLFQVIQQNIFQWDRKFRMNTWWKSPHIGESVHLAGPAHLIWTVSNSKFQ